MVWGGITYNKQADKQAQAEREAAAAGEAKAKQELLNKLKIEEVKVGTGAEAKTGDTVSVQYIGTLDSGQKFDSSYDHGQAFEFPLGAGQVIQGWDMGVVGMKVGGERKLTIPPELGYGSRAMGPIPANATLHFDIKLEKVNGGK